MDAIFCRRDTAGSMLLRTFLWSSWSHVGIVTPDLTVIEATAWHGVIERDLRDFIADASRYSVRSIPLPNDAAAISWARAQVGKPYDWPGVIGLGLRREWQDACAWFCSELLEGACAAGQRQRFLHQVQRVTPQHSWMVA